MHNKPVFPGFLLLLGVAACLVCLSACQREEPYSGTDAAVTFSVDTLRFDTVFTTLGSATRVLKVFNPQAQPILVDVALGVDLRSFFRINVDGLRGPVVNGVEIQAKDSIYIFVEVTIDPDQPESISPFVIEDQLRLTVNGNTYTAHLEAWGQNANYIPSTAGKGKGALLSCDLGQRFWDDPRPYVIYGILYVDSCTLVLPPGTRIYVHGGIVRNDNAVYNDGLLVFLKEGRLDSRGTIEKPVVIQGDRLEIEYSDVSAQWVGLLFWKESRGNRLLQTTIKNAIFGVRADSLAEVSLDGCRLYSMSAAGIIGRHSAIYAANCLIHSSDSYGLQLTYGGKYDFEYCTVASYQGQNEALLMTDFYCSDILCSQGVRINPLRANFTNCIITGSDADEIGLVRASENSIDFQYSLKNCVVKVDELTEPKNHPDFFDKCQNCIKLAANAKLFQKVPANDYSLDSMSVALGKGLPLSTVFQDIRGKSRKQTPDPGCFEF